MKAMLTAIVSTAIILGCNNTALSQQTFKPLQPTPDPNLGAAQSSQEGSSSNSIKWPDEMKSGDAWMYIDHLDLAHTDYSIIVYNRNNKARKIGQLNSPDFGVRFFQERKVEAAPSPIQNPYKPNDRIGVWYCIPQLLTSGPGISYSMTIDGGENQRWKYCKPGVQITSNDVWLRFRPQPREIRHTVDGVRPDDPKPGF